MSHNPVVAQVDQDILRISHGVHDLFARPSLTLKPCYGVPRAASSSRRAPSETAGDGDVSMRASVAPDAPRAEWLAGEALEAALAAEGGKERIEVRWPFEYRNGDEDWDGRAFVLEHALSLLGIKPSNNVHPLLLVPPAAPATLPLADQARYCQLTFEELNTPQLSMLPLPLAAIYGLNATTGVVLHIGRSTSEVAVVTDSIVRWECATSVSIGQDDCEKHLETLLLADTNLDAELKTAATVETWAPGQKEQLVREIREFIFAECTGDDIEVPPASTAAVKAVVAKLPEPEDESFDVAKKLTADVTPQAPVNTSHKSKKAQAAAASAAASKASAAADAAAAADFIIVTIPSLPEAEISVGSVRHRLAEPLLRGIEKGGDTVWEAVGRAVESSALSVNERLSVWDGVAVVGDMARFKSFPIAVTTFLAPCLLTSPELPSDVQASRVRLLTIPDYIANYKGATSDLAPFLGATMVAKVAFNDSAGKHYVTKIEYNAHGPASIYGVWNEA